MDPLAVSVSFAAILASISSLTLNTLELLRRAKKSSSVLLFQIDEIQVVRDVLEECYGIIQARQNPKVPPSVERALRICEMRSIQLEEAFAIAVDLNLVSKKRLTKLRNVKTLMVTENERKAAFKGFRSAVLLLRDLCSEIRLQHQLVDMSAGLAALLADRYDEAASQTAEAPRPDHIYIDGEDNHTEKEEHDQSVLSQTLKTKLKGKVGREWTELIKQNFTRNATIVVDSGIGDQPRRVTVRAKMDTGCNDNLITFEVFEKFGMDKSMLVNIPEEDQFDLVMLEGVRCTILYKIHLIWYYDGDMKMRHSDFFVVKTGPFDMLIGSYRFAQEFAEQGRPGLVIGKKSKKKADRKKERDNHATHLKQQEILELQERNAQQSQAALQSLRDQASSRAQQPPQGQTPQTQAPPTTSPGQSSQGQAPISYNQPITPVPSSSTQQQTLDQGQTHSLQMPLPYQASNSASAPPAVNLNVLPTLLTTSSNSTSAPAAVNANELPTPLTTPSSPQIRHAATNSLWAGTQSTTQALNPAASEAPQSSAQPETHAPALVSSIIAPQASGQSSSHGPTPTTPAPDPAPAPVPPTALHSPASSGSRAPAPALAVSAPPQSSTQATIQSAALPQHQKPPGQSGSGTSSVGSTFGQNTTQSGSATNSISTLSQRNPPSPSSEQSAQSIQQVPTASAQINGTPPTKKRGKISSFFKKRK